MRHVLWGVVLAASITGLVTVTKVVAAQPPTVTAVVEAVGRSVDRGVMIVTGTNLNKIKTFEVQTLAGADVGTAEVAANLKTVLVLRMPVDLAAGTYQLSLADAKGNAVTSPFAYRSEYRRTDATNLTVNSNIGPSLVGIANTTDNAFSFGVTGQINSAQGVGVLGDARSTELGASRGVQGSAAAPDGKGVFGIASSTTGFCSGVQGEAGFDGAGVVAIMHDTGTANSVALHVDHSGVSLGNIARFEHQGNTVIRFDLSGKGLFNGGTQVGGADFAERVQVTAPAGALEPGDVMVVDASGTRRFALSDSSESTLVAGIYSTKPGVLGCPGDVDRTDAAPADQISLAITGIVPCKVCDEGGSIRAGDLLVSSSIPGYAKKAPASPKVGTVLGKALAVLASGKGRIEVLISMR